jgi:UDP-galactopyranose mutase
VHSYGPHYFRTRDAGLVRYLSRFTDWVPARYEVRSLLRGKLFPFPINLTTLEMFFGQKLDATTAGQLLARLRQPIDSPGNSEEFVLGRVGRELFEAFYKGYTLKQWGVPASDLAPEVCGRIPIRLDRDGSYVDHRFQMMPRHGFTTLFRRMLRHRRIRLLLDCDFREVRSLVRPRQATVYTGPIDDYFDRRLGALPYRSLRFDFVPYSAEFVQPCVQINYPNDFTWTRSVEIKHVTRQTHPHTVVSYETPAATGEPFYPMPAPANRALYERYRQLADLEQRQRRVWFCGRLAQYRYFNTDEVIGEALACFEQIKKRCAPGVESSASSPVCAMI